MIKPYGRTTPVPLRHRQIDKLTMLDWIRTRLEAGHPTPTDAEIMERFGFLQAEQARTLLADLSDAGKITIFGTGDDREILLGRVRPSQRGTIERPVPSVVREDARPANARKAGAERLASILRDVSAKRAAPNAAVAQLGDAVAKMSEAGKTLAEQLQPIVEAAQAGETSTIDARPVKAATLAAVASTAEAGAARFTINAAFKADAALYERVKADAAREGMSVNGYVGRIAKAALTGEPITAQPERKPLLRAEMTAAAIRNDMPIDAFVRLLLERGFQSFLADEQKGIAA